VTRWRLDKMSILLVFAPALAFPGCADPNAPLTESQAVDIAVKTVKSAGGDPARYAVADTNYQEGTWWVLFRDRTVGDSRGPNSFLVRVDPHGTGVVMNANWFADSLRDRPTVQPVATP